MSKNAEKYHSFHKNMNTSASLKGLVRPQIIRERILWQCSNPLVLESDLE